MILEIDEKDLTTRKHWLWGLFGVGLFNIFLTCFEPIILSNYKYKNSFWMHFIFVLVSTVFTSLLYWYCAYKKPGTSLLAVTYFFGLISIPLSIIFFFATFFNISTIGTSLEPIVEEGLSIYLTSIACYIYWVFISGKMRIVNKKIQILNAPDYLRNLANMKDVLCVKILNDNYSALIQGWPQFESFTTKEYKQKKTQLLKAADHESSI